MNESKTAILAFCAFAATFWQWFCPYTPLFIILLATNVMDYGSGILLAIDSGELSSKVGIKGAIKKIGYWVLVATTVGIEYLMLNFAPITGVPHSLFQMLTVTVIIWLCVNEAISILENLGGLGVPLPTILKNAIYKLKQSMDSKSDEDTE